MKDKPELSDCAIYRFSCADFGLKGIEQYPLRDQIAMLELTEENGDEETGSAERAKKK